MKTKLVWVGLITALISCAKKPEANFVTPNNERGSVPLGQKITFLSTSYNAISYTWDFGDGFIIPKGRDYVVVEHAFERTGTYPVTLTVYHANKSDKTTKTIRVVAQ